MNEEEGEEHARFGFAPFVASHRADSTRRAVVASGMHAAKRMAHICRGVTFEEEERARGGFPRRVVLLCGSRLRVGVRFRLECVRRPGCSCCVFFIPRRRRRLEARNAWIIKSLWVRVMPWKEERASSSASNERRARVLSSAHPAEEDEEEDERDDGRRPLEGEQASSLLASLSIKYKSTNYCEGRVRLCVCAHVEAIGPWEEGASWRNEASKEEVTQRLVVMEAQPQTNENGSSTERPPALSLR